MHLIFKTAMLAYFKSPPSTEEKIEGRIKVTVRRGRTRNQLLDDHKEKSGFWKLKGEGLDHTLWRTRFGRGLWICRKTYCSVNELRICLKLDENLLTNQR
jgi:hypothetical protein